MKKLANEIIEELQDDACLLLAGEADEICYAANMAVSYAEEKKWAQALENLKVIESSLAACLNVVRPWGTPPEEGDYEQTDRY